MAAALLACAPSPPADPGAVSVHDSAGTAIVEIRAFPADEWRLDPEPLLVIGSEAVDADEPLYRVRAVVAVGDRIAVANGGSSQVLVYRTDGTLVHAIGRRGQGPGEFESLWDLFVLPDDSLLTYDAGPGRFQVFDSTGRFVRSFRLDGPEPRQPPPGASPVGVLEPGVLVVRSIRPSDPAVQQSGTSRATMDLYRFTLDGRCLDTLASAPGWEAYDHHGVATALRNVPLPFGHGSHCGIAGDHILVAASDGNEVRTYADDGALVRITRRVAPPGPVIEPREIERIVDRAVETAPAWMRQDVEALYAAMPMPARKPPLNGLIAAPDGSFWIRTHAGGEADRRYIVFDDAGNPAAWLTLPSAFGPMEISGGDVLGVWTDSLGVESVRRFSATTSDQV